MKTYEQSIQEWFYGSPYDDEREERQRVEEIREKKFNNE